MRLETVGDILDEMDREAGRVVGSPTSAPAVWTPGPWVQVHAGVIQGSDEWLEARRGLFTASEIDRILTPTLKVAANDKTRQHLFELAAQRISHHVEPHYISDAMLRGEEEEADARATYAERHAPVQQIGFITNTRHGFTLGYSPDGLVGNEGLIECKSRAQRFQVQTVVEHAAAGTIPTDYLLQVQTGLLVTERKWLDFLSFSNGLPMLVVRVFPDPEVQAAILDAVAKSEARIAEIVGTWNAAVRDTVRLIPTIRKIRQEMFLG